MKKQKKQKGFMLVGVVIASVMLLILAFAIVRYGQVDADTVTRSKVQANLQNAVDSGLERAVNTLSSNWASPTNLAGFSSLNLTNTTYAYTELPGTKYVVKILTGFKDVTFSAKLLDDAATINLVNKGDSSFDRTVLVRAADTITGVTVTALGVVHKNDVVKPITFPGLDASGQLNLNSKTDGGSFNSCTGVNPGASSGCSGTVQGSSIIGNNTGNCIPKTSLPTLTPTPIGAATATPIPLNVPSDATGVLPGCASTSSAFSMSDCTISSGKYRCASWDGSGNSTVNLNTCAGKVEIYIDGNITMSGTVAILSGCAPGSTTGGTPASAIIYCGGKTVTFAGGGVFQVALYAPNADVSWNGGAGQNGAFYGAISAKTIDGPSSNGFKIYYDDCLSVVYASICDSNSNSAVVS